MLHQNQTSKIPKKMAQKLSKFSYYVDTFFPDHFQMKKKSLENDQKHIKPINQLLTKQGNKGLIYNYFYSQCGNPAAIDSNSILQSVKKLYLNQGVIKLNQTSYSRQTQIKHSYLPMYGNFCQTIDFILVPCPQKTQPRQYFLYVIHNCNSFKTTQQVKNIQWQNFIQRYHFIDRNYMELDTQGKITYQLVYVNRKQIAFFDLQQKLTNQFIRMHCTIVNANLQNLQKLQGYLFQRSSQVQAIKKMQDDVAFSDQHKRQNKIPVEYFKRYLSLKKQIYKLFIQINSTQSESSINKYFYDNLICRYLVAKQYNFQQAKKCILQYLRWQKQIKDKYPSLQSFRDIHQAGAYRYIGEDFMGRPVILSKACQVQVDKIQVEKYCDYYIYFLEIYLRTKMRGYVDQMVIIGDLNNLGTNNFKLAITKRNVADSLKYGPQRQLALITVNVSTFAYTAWNFIKPLLPKKTLSKIQIVGHNKKDIVQTLITRMDISIIPYYLGGENKKFQNNDVRDQFENYVRNSDQDQLHVDQVQTVQVESQILQNQIVKGTSGIKDNALFSFFDNVSRTFGLSLN